MPWKTRTTLSDTPMRDLRRLAAEIGQRQDQAGRDDAERIEPAEEGDDDGGEAVAGRDRLGCSWPIGPDTSEMPASPASAPDSRKAKNTMRPGEKPAKRPARGLWPSTLTSKPFSVCDSMNQTSTAATRAKTKPQLARARRPAQICGRMASVGEADGAGKVHALRDRARGRAPASRGTAARHRPASGWSGSRWC